MAELDDLIKNIMTKMGETAATSTPTSSVSQTTEARVMSREDYPLYEKHNDTIKSPGGKSLEEITLAEVLSGNVSSQDLRITRETLKYQGQIAEDSGRGAIQQNFQRAAELTAIPDERLLEMYGQLRPYRSSKQDLEELAVELETQYNATITAEFVREAAEFYEQRKKLKGDN